MLNFTYIGIAFFYTILLIFVLKRDLRSIINRYYVVYLFGALLWQLTIYLYLFVDLGNYLLLVGKLNYAAGPIFSISFLGFFYYFPITTFQIPPWIKRAFWIITILLVGIVLFTPWIDKSETMTANGPVPELGEGYLFYLLHVLILPLVTMYLGAKKYFKLSGINKTRFSYAFWVYVPTIITLLVFTLILPIFGINDFFVYSPMVILPIVISSFYSIVKYRFLDIRFLLARAVAFLIFIFLCSTIYFFVIFLVVNQLLGIKIDLLIAGGALLISIFAAFSFQPILKMLKRTTNRIFYKNYYDTELFLAELTRIMAQKIVLSEMTDTILAQLMKTMCLTKGAFLIMEEKEKPEFFGTGYGENDFESKQFEDFILKHLKSKPVIFDEIEENGIKKICRDYDISIAIPIKVKNRLVAILFLGPKMSGEIYNGQDINFLNIFASEAGIAIQNSKSYEQIKKFNVSLEKKVEERTAELQKSQKRELAKARDIAHLKDEFVFIASHELRTPVTAIKGFLSMVTESPQKLPSDVRENLSYMSAASDHLGQLINDLLEISRSDAGKLDVSSHPADIIPVLQANIQEVTPQAAKDNIKITFKNHPKTVQAMVDEKKIKEVFMNLLSNAIKYNRKNGSVDVILSAGKKEIYIEVSDTGYGIPKDQQDKIFQKFFRAANERTGDVLGTGLGLFITRMLVEKMGGKIGFTSIENKGTTFKVTLIKAADSREK